MASYFGKHIHISIFGQSHSQVIGVTVDGLPAGESVDLEMCIRDSCRGSQACVGTLQKRQPEIPSPGLHYPSRPGARQGGARQLCYDRRPLLGGEQGANHFRG